MDHFPELSVVIRGAEVNDWLRQTVESVLASEGVELEVIMVLNGPTVPVQSKAIASEEQNYPWLKNDRLTVLRFDRYIGVSNAMRAGCDVARAPLIANVDGDDVVQPGKFRAQLNYLNAHPECVLVGTGGQVMDKVGQTTGTLVVPVGDDIRPRLLLLNPIPHSSIVMRADAYRQVGGYRENLNQFEDYDLFLRLAALGPIALLLEPGISYRVHATNTSKGAAARGRHIDAVAEGRRQLAQALGISPAIAVPQHLFWRAIQFARSSGLIRPLHEYFTFFKR